MVSNGATWANGGTIYLVPKNIYGEDICWFTDIPVTMCSHCRGLPWESDVEGWDD